MKRLSLLSCLLAVLAAAPVHAADSPTRGELLYGTHCIACHNSQMHWRDKRLATDWPELVAQVRRWQGVAKLGWSEDDILEVARHLNQRIYRYPLIGSRASS
ncbi:MAG: cytochrome C [Piscinibacter sp.]